MNTPWRNVGACRPVRFTVTQLHEIQVPVTLCADCTLLSHKEHYLTSIADSNDADEATLQAPKRAKSATARVVGTDKCETPRLIDASERIVQGNKTVQSNTRTGASRSERCGGCRKCSSDPNCSTWSLRQPTGLGPAPPSTPPPLSYMGGRGKPKIWEAAYNYGVG